MAALLGSGLFYPPIDQGQTFTTTLGAPALSTNVSLNTLNDSFAMMGRIQIAGRPTGAQTITGTSGTPGKIAFQVASGTTFSNGGTTIDIGIQGVSTTAGVYAQPDGTFKGGLKMTATGGGGAITNNAWNEVTLSAGSTTFTQGDLIAVVFKVTGYGGADVVVITPGVQSNSSNGDRFPMNNFSEAGGAWAATGAVGKPNVLITFDDGTLATIDNMFPITATAAATFSSNAERGEIFQVPFDCDIDALWAGGVGCTDANSDFSVILYEDPTGTPNALATVTELAEQGAVYANDRFVTATLAAPVSLTADTDYAVIVKGTGSSNTRMRSFTLPAAAHRAFIGAGTTRSGATRTGASGAFTGSTTEHYHAGVRVVSVSTAPAIQDVNVVQVNGTSVTGDGGVGTEWGPGGSNTATVDANVVQVNGVTVTGDGGVGTEWGPA